MGFMSHVACFLNTKMQATFEIKRYLHQAVIQSVVTKLDVIVHFLVDFYMLSLAAA